MTPQVASWSGSGPDVSRMDTLGHAGGVVCLGLTAHVAGITKVSQK